MNSKICSAVVLALSCAAAAVLVARADSIDVDMLAGEKWWGGAVILGEKMPFGENSVVECDMLCGNYGNPAVPMFLSSKGRYIHCDEPFAFCVSGGVIRARSKVSKFETGKPACDLRGAYLWCRDKWFPPSGKAPDLALVAAPQYNTWIELQYNQNEADILAYAKAVKENGFPPGKWLADDGSLVEGPARIVVRTPLSRLPYFIRQGKGAVDKGEGDRPRRFSYGR